MIIRVFMSLMLAACILQPALAQNAGPATITVTVTDMHCAHCARKITSRLFSVPGVKAVKTDVGADTATITPQANRQPSPKGIWEAVEKAGFKPTKIVTPAGTFEKKPEA